MRLTIATIAAVIIAGCSEEGATPGETSPKADASVTDVTAAEDASAFDLGALADASESPFDTALPDARCEGDADQCCNGVRCVGECIVGETGTPRCDCFGREGGCVFGTGQVCCSRTMRCENHLVCSP